MVPNLLQIELFLLCRPSTGVSIMVYVMNIIVIKHVKFTLILQECSTLRLLYGTCNPATKRIPVEFMWHLI